MFFSQKIGIDLGTCNSLVFVPGKGLVLQEPSVVAVSFSENRIVAIGDKAKEMLGKTPEDIIVYRPLRDGVIAEYRITEAMLRYFIKATSKGFRFFKPELLVGVPAGITSTEKRAVVEAGMSAGAKAVYVAKEPVLAAIGAGIPINSCSGHMIVDIGGGTSEVAVISLGGVVAWHSVRTAGDKMDLAILDYMKRKYNLAVGAQTAEEIKIKIGTALPEEKEQYMEVKGRDMVSGMPRTVKISSNETAEALSDVLTEIMHEVKRVLRDTPPELSADIMDKGMILSGGGALLKNFDEFLSRSTGVPCFVAQDPLLCVAKGAGVVLENLDLYKRSIMVKK